MRILAVTNLYPNPIQPHRAAFNRQQFRALATEHQVQMIAPIAWTGELAARRRGRRASRLGADRVRIADGMLIRHPRYAFPPRVLRGWYGRFFLESVRRSFHEAVREFRPDVVLGCWAYPDGWATVRLAREAGLPVAIKVHGSDVLTAGHRLDRRKQTAEALTSADAVITVSRHLGSHVAALGVDPSRVHVVYNGIDDRLFHPGSRESARSALGITDAEPLILFVGNLVPVKGPDVLIDALASLVQDGVHLRCAFVGSGPLQRRLLARAAAGGIAENVRFLGSRPLDELPHWYHAADLLVLPSRSEGIPNVLLEAAACGTPFIASSVGGIPEMADAGALAPPGDAAALAERMRSALVQPHLPIVPPPLRPGSWAESARALADALRRITAEIRGRTARAG